MKNEVMSEKMMIATLISFMLGSSIITGGSSVLVQDAWVSVILGALMAWPMLMVYSKIIFFYPNKNIYDVFLELFGEIVGRIIIILFIWYSLHLGALVFRNFAEFIQITSKPETPQIIIILSMALVCFYLVKSGVRTLGKGCIFVLSIVLLIIIMTVFASWSSSSLRNIQPIFNHTISEFFFDTHLHFSFPYAETVLFLSISDSLSEKANPNKIFSIALIITVLILLMITLRNILLLGHEMLKISLFPSYVATRIISMGKFLTKIEGFVMINFMLVGIVKIVVCLISSTKGICRFFNFKDYKTFAVPVSIIMSALAISLYNNSLEMLDFTKIYAIYAIPFQVIIPLFVLLIAKYKNKNVPNNKNMQLIKNKKIYKIIVD